MRKEKRKRGRRGDARNQSSLGEASLLGTARENYNNSNFLFCNRTCRALLATMSVRIPPENVQTVGEVNQ